MNVKKSSSRVRGPLPTLWSMVHGIDDDQWRQLKAFSEVYGKGSLQFKLLELLRSMKAYDPESEKSAFAENDLYSLRRTARKWLVRTGRRLAFAIKEAEEQQGDVAMLMAWGHLEEAWDAVSEAKVVARAQEDFVVLTGLLEQEKNIARAILQGSERDVELQRIANETLANLRHLGLAAQMAACAAFHLEPVRNQLASAGVLDTEAVGRYFETLEHQMRLSDLPVSVQIEKLTIDEFFYNMAGDFEAATIAAEHSVQLLQAHAFLRAREPERLPKIFMNLVAFYIQRGLLDSVLDTIARFEAEGPENADKKSNYLLRYIFVLFMAAMDCDRPELARRGLELFARHRDYLDTLPVEPLRSATLLYACTYHLGQGEIDHARREFAKLQVHPMDMGRLLYKSMAALVHLILLFEDRDAVGLESIGLQYRRKLRQLLPAESSVFAVMAFLRGKANLEHRVTCLKALQQLADGLRRRQSHPEEARILWHDPLIRWMEHQLAVSNYPESR